MAKKQTTILIFTLFLFILFISTSIAAPDSEYSEKTCTTVPAITSKVQKCYTTFDITDKGLINSTVCANYSKIIKKSYENCIVNYFSYDKYFNNGISYQHTDLTAKKNTLTNDYEVRKGGYFAAFNDDSVSGDLLYFEKEGYYFRFNIGQGEISFKDSIKETKDIKEDKEISSGQELPTIKENKIDYKNAYPFSTLNYEYTDSKIKEKIIVSDFRNTTAWNDKYPYLEFSGTIYFSNELKICANSQCFEKGVIERNFQTKGKIEFRDRSTDKLIFYIDEPEIIDAAGIQTKGTYYISGIPGAMSYNLLVDTSFLVNATYPVIVDPTITIDTADSEVLDDTYLQDSSISDIIRYSYENIRIGNDNTTGVSSDYKAFIKFNITEIPDTDVSVTAATLYLKRYNSTTIATNTSQSKMNVTWYLINDNTYTEENIQGQTCYQYDTFANTCNNGGTGQRGTNGGTNMSSSYDNNFDTFMLTPSGQQALQRPLFKMVPDYDAVLQIKYGNSTTQTTVNVTANQSICYVNSTGRYQFAINAYYLSGLCTIEIGCPDTNSSGSIWTYTNRPPASSRIFLTSGTWDSCRIYETGLFYNISSNKIAPTINYSINSTVASLVYNTTEQWSNFNILKLINTSYALGQNETGIMGISSANGGTNTLTSYFKSKEYSANASDRPYLSVTYLHTVPQTINSCTEIDSPVVYTLSGDINATQSQCLLVSTSGATIDCNNNWIDGQGLYQELIYLYDDVGGKSLTIQNCKIRNYINSGDPISIYMTASNIKIINVTINDSTDLEYTWGISTVSYVGTSTLNITNLQHYFSGSNRPSICRGISLSGIISTTNLYVTNSKLSCGIDAWIDLGSTFNINLNNVTDYDNNSFYVVPSSNSIVANYNNISQFIIMDKTNINFSNITINRNTYMGNSFTLTTATKMRFDNITINNGVTGFYYQDSAGDTTNPASSYIRNSRFINLTGEPVFYGYESDGQDFYNNTVTANAILVPAFSSCSNNAVYCSVYNNVFNITFSPNFTSPYLYYLDMTAGAEKIYNNYFHLNTNGASFFYAPSSFTNSSKKTYLNTSLQNGTRIYGAGSLIGGNYYSKIVTGSVGPQGESVDCADKNRDGICDSGITFTLTNATLIDYYALSDGYDNIVPIYYNDTYTNTEIKWNTTVNFIINLTDDYILGSYIFGWNDSGSWVNDTSVLIDSGLYSKIIDTNKAITSIRGEQVCRQYWFNDSYGNSNQTSIACFNVSNTPPQFNATFISPSPSTVLDNLTCNYTSHDHDGDNISIVTTNWTISGNLSSNHNNTLPGGTLLGTDSVTCSVLITDGFDNSSEWGEAPLVVMDDVLAPIFSDVGPQQSDVYTDTTYRVNVTCIDPEGSGIANGYPKIIYIDPDGIEQGNYTMSVGNESAGYYYYATTFGKVGVYSDFRFYCQDSQSHDSNYTANFTVTASIRPVTSAPSGGGSNTLFSTVAKKCNWNFDNQEITFYSNDNAKRLVIINSENFSISPTYTLSGTYFSLGGAKALLSGGSQTELTIIKNAAVAKNYSKTEKLTVSSSDCLPITVTIKYVSESGEFEYSATAIGRSIFEKLNSDINLFGSGFIFKFYILTLLSMILVFFIVRKADIGLGIKIASGTIMVIFINVLLIAIMASTSSGISMSTTPFVMSNTTQNASVTIIPNINNSLNLTNQTINNTEPENTMTDYISDIFSKEVVKTSFSGKEISIKFWFIFAALALIMSAGLFLFNKFDWWANILIGLLSSLVATVIIYLIL